MELAGHLSPKELPFELLEDDVLAEASVRSATSQVSTDAREATRRNAYHRDEKRQRIALSATVSPLIHPGITNAGNGVG